MCNKYFVTLAFDVSAYATLYIEAETEAEAIALARKGATDECFDIAWDTAYSGDNSELNQSYRVVDVASR